MNILVADDELVSRSKLEKLVSVMGHTVISAADGKTALDLWIKHQPEMIITDWMMPGLSGIDLIKEVRQQQGSRYTYIIMITSQNEFKDLITGMEAGADEFIRKPFIKEELILRIKTGERIINFGSRDIVIFSMACLAEARDNDTGYHLERIRYYSKILAEHLAAIQNYPELTASFIDNLLLTSPLHDIGKIGIPDFVLLKPGRLDEREYEIMKNHTEIGYDSLRNALAKYPRAEYLKMSAEIALYHHEKYNGSGYPKGLKGDEIPLSARIVALADVYDALVSKRVYKSAMPHETARSIIIQERGQHFDPKIVDAFLNSEKEFLGILEQYINQ